MMKKYKRSLILTSAIAISPILIGLLMWGRLPDRIAVHFGSGNIANGWGSKPLAVFGIPLFMLALHLLCFFATANDPKRKNVNEQLIKWTLWIIPVLSVVCCVSIYAIAVDIKVDIGMIINLLVGLTFLVSGNYMHKLKQNYTVGIKLPWTLHSEENWNRTHRLASWLWIVCGLCFMGNSIVQNTYLLFPVVLVMILVPIIYSFVLYKKGI